MLRLTAIASLILAAVSTFTVPSRAGEVSGRVEMPSICSPLSSAAVVTLESLDGKALPLSRSSASARVALVRQHGLQFEPRVQAITVGQTIRFTNEDRETHNVHILTPGAKFNQSMAPGRPVDYQTDQPGVLRLACDIHSHMRGYVVVAPTPWSAVVRDGKFRLQGVEPGRYKLVAWHEMGEGLSKVIEVADGKLDVGTLTLQGPPVPASSDVVSAPVRPWSEVIDRISLKLSEARATASLSGGAAKARKLAEDAYWDEFESSDMETAVRGQLGYQRAGEIEEHFRDFRRAISALSKGESSTEQVVEKSRDLLLNLYRAAQDLDHVGVTDRSKVNASNSPSTASASIAVGDLPAKKRALAETFAKIQALADAGDDSEASSTMTSAYFDAFEPLERLLVSRRPQDVRPLEIRFNALRGRISSGFQGAPLASSLAELQQDIFVSVDSAIAAPAGSFLPAFLASLVTIVREGVEVILILTMLVALVVKTGRRSALPAIWWGVGLAAAASLLTAVGLNLLIAQAQGRARELLEGWVLLAAAGVLFYVSYWLISQTEAKRWTDFLKRQAAEGAKAGAVGTLGLTAFLAVYREGAETALMYQAMIAGQGGAASGLAGLAAGLLVGGVLLALIYRVLKSTSVRLPLGTFFKFTGAVLFLMAVVFAGNGVFELQQAGILRVTDIRWMRGFGVSWLGLYPNVQALTVQALLVGGAAISLILPAFDRKVPIVVPKAPVKRPERVGAGV